MLSIHRHVVYHVGRNESLLGLDLAVSLDGDFVVGLERGDGVVGDVGAGTCQQRYV